MAELPQEPEVKTVSDGELQLVIFSTGSEEFGVEIMNIQEIIRMTSITKIPQAPDYIRGIINLRGRIIVVVSLNVVLGMASRGQDENTRIIVASIGDTVMGFVVDSVSEVIRLPERSIEPAPAAIADKIGTEYVLGVGKLDNRLLVLLNLDKILGSKELHSVRGISTEAAEMMAT